MNSLQIKFLVFITVVFIITMVFAFIIYRQFNKVGKTALEAKQRQQEYQDQLDAQNEGFTQKDFEELTPDDQQGNPIEK